MSYVPTYPPGHHPYGNCSTWNQPQCSGHSRPQILNTIQNLANAARTAGTLSPLLHSEIQAEITLYFVDRNCCTAASPPPGTSNCTFLDGALQDAQSVPPNWVQCNTRLQLGH